MLYIINVYSCCTYLFYFLKCFVVDNVAILHKISRRFEWVEKTGVYYICLGFIFIVLLFDLQCVLLRLKIMYMNTYFNF